MSGQFLGSALGAGIGTGFALGGIATPLSAGVAVVFALFAIWHAVNGREEAVENDESVTPP
jgi:hypothetical protein